MSVKIRLQRGGAAHTPHYRIVVAESRFRRDGRFIEVIGTYNPVAKRLRDKCAIKLERADHWLGVGAQPSDTVRGLINRFRRGVYEVDEPEVPAPAPTPAPEPEPEAEAPAEEPTAEEAPAEEPAAKAEEAPAEAEATDDADEEPAAEAAGESEETEGGEEK